MNSKVAELLDEAITICKGGPGSGPRPGKPRGPYGKKPPKEGSASTATPSAHPSKPAVSAAASPVLNASSNAKAIAASFKKAVAAMPSGTHVHDKGASWASYGGYRGQKQISTSLKKLMAMGFERKAFSPSNSPDGNVVGSGTHYAHPDGHRLTVGSSYGSTASSNRFYMDLIKAPDPTPSAGV